MPSAAVAAALLNRASIEHRANALSAAADNYAAALKIVQSDPRIRADAKVVGKNNRRRDGRRHAIANDEDFTLLHGDVIINRLDRAIGIQHPAIAADHLTFAKPAIFSFSDFESAVGADHDIKRELEIGGQNFPMVALNRINLAAFDRDGIRSVIGLRLK